jgi:polyphosphate kinase
MLDTQLAARRGVWAMQADGSYVPCWTGNDEPSSHQVLIELAAKRQKQGTRRRRRKPRVFARRSAR